MANATTPVIQINEGNVGIGITNPATKLHVGGTLNVDASGLGAYIYSTQSIGLRVRGGGNAQDIAQFQRVGGSTVAVIDSAGNVGIGTTDPLAKLQVDNPGQGEFAGGDSSASGGSHLMLKDEGSTSRTLMSGPSVVFQTPANSDGTNPWATSRLLGSPAAAGSARGTFSIQVRDAYDPLGDGTSWNWRTALTAINTGNVGIGTTSPDAKLVIQDVTKSLTGNVAGTAQGTLSLVSSDALAVDAGASMVFGGNYITGSSTKIAYAAITGRKELATSGNADGYLAFYTWLSTGMTEKMRIDNVGNVGLGTDTPTTGYSKVLQIHSPAAPGSTLRLTDSVSTAAVNKGFEILQYGTDSYILNRSNGPMIFWTNNSHAMTILANHNVGIGTTSPTQATLCVSGSTFQTGDLLLSDSNTYSPEIKMTNSAHTIGIDYQSNETLRFITRSGAITVPITFQMRAGTITATNFILSSDERKKTKVKDLSRDSINVNWKSFEMKGSEGEYRAGVIAQELEEKHPEFVRTDDEGMKSVAYIDLLIAKIAELEARLEKAGI